MTNRDNALPTLHWYKPYGDQCREDCAQIRAAVISAMWGDLDIMDHTEQMIYIPGRAASVEERVTFRNLSEVLDLQQFEQNQLIVTILVVDPARLFASVTTAIFDGNCSDLTSDGRYMYGYGAFHHAPISYKLAMAIYNNTQEENNNAE